MKVGVYISETDLEGDFGDVSGVEARCERCGQKVEVFGQEESSKLRAFAMLREDCPLGERNFYEETYYPYPDS